MALSGLLLRLPLRGVILGALLAVAAGLASQASPAAAQRALTKQPGPGAEAIAGRWSGTYFCAQGRTALELTLRPEKDGRIAAHFAFGPLPDGPDMPAGAFTMRGAFDPATGALVLQAERWIDRPAGYVTVNLAGTVAGQRYRGTVTMEGLAPGAPENPCTTFTLERRLVSRLIGPAVPAAGVARTAPSASASRSHHG